MRKKIAVFYKVHEVIKNGVIFDEKKIGKVEDTTHVLLPASVTIAGKEYICQVIVKRLKDRNQFYLHEVELKEKLPTEERTGFYTGLTSGGAKELIAQKAEEVHTIWENCSKVVDENGKPLVMYHGSPTSGIREFEIHKALYGEGAFFTSSSEEALSYTGLDEDEFEDWDEFDAAATDSGLMYEVFLNIRDKERFYERNGEALHARAVAANEIKSATDNRGTFDGSNADIPFSLTIGKDRICRTQK